jgi:hypothetical protein
MITLTGKLAAELASQRGTGMGYRQITPGSATPATVTLVAQVVSLNETKSGRVGDPLAMAFPTTRMAGRNIRLGRPPILCVSSCENRI